jgi:hypothetical protein
MMAPAAVGSTTLAVGIVAVAVVGDVPEVVEATCCTLGPPRPFVMTTLALASEVGNGEAVAEAAGISIVLNHDKISTNLQRRQEMTSNNNKQTNRVFFRLSLYFA